MTKADYARNCIRENPHLTQKEVITKVCNDRPDMFPTRKQAWSVLQTIRRTNAEAIAPPVVSNGGVFLSESDMRERYDIKRIVFKELSTIPDGKYIKDTDLTRRFAGRGGFRGVLDSPEAQPYRGKAGGVIYWGHPSGIARLKGDGILI